MDALTPLMSLPILAIVIWLLAHRHDGPDRTDPLLVRVRIVERRKDRRH